MDWRVVALDRAALGRGSVSGALLADDVFSEALLYGLIAGVLVWSGIDLAFRPIAARRSRAPARRAAEACSPS